MPDPTTIQRMAQGRARQYRLDPSRPQGQTGAPMAPPVGAPVTPTAPRPPASYAPPPQPYQPAAPIEDPYAEVVKRETANLENPASAPGFSGFQRELQTAANSEAEKFRARTGGIADPLAVGREMARLDQGVRNQLALYMSQQQSRANEALNQAAAGRSQFRLGQADVGLRTELGRGDLGLRGGELGLKTELGRGELGLGRDELGLKGELGRGELDLRGELGRGQLELGRNQLAQQQAQAEMNAQLERERIAAGLQESRARNSSSLTGNLLSGALNLAGSFFTGGVAPWPIASILGGNSKTTPSGLDGILAGILGGSTGGAQSSPGEFARMGGF